MCICHTHTPRPPVCVQTAARCAQCVVRAPTRFSPAFDPLPRARYISSHDQRTELQRVFHLSHACPCGSPVCGAWSRFGELGYRVRERTEECAMTDVWQAPTELSAAQGPTPFPSRIAPSLSSRVRDGRDASTMMWSGKATSSCALPARHDCRLANTCASARLGCCTRRSSTAGSVGHATWSH